MDSDSQNSSRSLSRFKQFSIFALLVIMTIFAVVVATYASSKRQQARKTSVMVFKAAIQGGNLEKVDELLKFDPSLAHGREHHGAKWDWTALQMSAGSPEVFHRILEENPDLEEPARNGVTALTRIALDGRVYGSAHVLPLMEELIKRGADVNGAHPVGDWTSTPIQGAAAGTPTGAKNLELLLEAGADVKINHRSDGLTCMHMAASNENDQAIELLIRAGANVDAKDKNGETPLHVVMQNDWIPTARFLISHGADPVATDIQNRIPSEGFTYNNSLIFDAIEVAHDQGDLSKVDAMLESAPQVLNWTKPSPMLVQAATSGRLDILEYLLAKGANPRVVYNNVESGRHSKRTILHAMSTSRTIPTKVATIVERLNKAGVDAEATDNRGQTPLHVAVEHHNLAMLDALIAIGANANAKDTQGRTLLHVASERHGDTILSALMAIGADLDATDAIGRTPLHVTAARHNHPMLHALIAAGADLHARDSAGSSVMDAAFLNRPNRGSLGPFPMPQLPAQFRRQAGRTAGRLETHEILAKAGHKPNALYAAATGNIQLLEELDEAELFAEKTEKHITPLYIAVAEQQADVVKWLLSQGADPNAQKSMLNGSPHGNDTLAMALNGGNVDVVLALIEGGADVNGSNPWFGTPLHFVIERNFDPKVFQALLDHGADETATYHRQSVRQCAVMKANQGNAGSKKYLELLDAHEQKAK